MFCVEIYSFRIVKGLRLLNASSPPPACIQLTDTGRNSQYPPANHHAILFPGHNHLLTTGSNDHSLAGTRAIIKVSGHWHW